MSEWLKDLGITVPQIITFLAAIPVAYLSAKFGARETRRQFEQKAEIEKRQAAAELIHPLLAFAFQCDRASVDSSLAASTSSSHLDAVKALHLPIECNRNAAVVGPEVAARVLKIFVLRTRIENSIATDLAVGCPADEPDGADRFASWMTLLELRARYAADLAAKAAGLPVSHNERDLEDLLKDAMRYGHEIDSGDEHRWP